MLWDAEAEERLREELAALREAILRGELYAPHGRLHEPGGIDPVRMRVSAVSSGGGHVIKENGAVLPQRAGLNFASGLVASDNSPADQTDVSLLYGVPVAVGDSNAPGSSETAARADHVHQHDSAGHVAGGSAHAHTGGQGGTVQHASLGGVTADQHHPQAHGDADHTGPSRIEVQDEGATIAARATLNFTGAGVTASDDPQQGRIVINIPGGAGHTIQENGAALPQRSGLNFASGLAAADDAAGDKTDVNILYGTPVAVGDANAPGTSEAAARADHVHQHDSAGHVSGGNAHAHTGGQGGTVQHGSLGGVTPDQHHPQAHGDADHTSPTRVQVQDDGVSVSQRATLNFGSGMAAADNAADGRADISLLYGTPVAVGTANAEGSAQAAARSDHVHEHDAAGHVAGGNAHAHTAGQGGTIAHASLGGVTADQHHPQAHSDADHTSPSRVQVQGGGATVAARPTLNFTGAGVTASDDAQNNRIVIDIPGGTGHTVQENGTALPARAGLNFGSGLVATDDAAGDKTDVSVVYGTPVAVGDANAPGSSEALVRADHVHEHDSAGHVAGGSAHAHVGGQGGTIQHASLGGVTADQHHPQAHSDADHTSPSRVQIQDEGVSVAARPTLNFTGAGVTASDDPQNNRIIIDIPGGGGGGGGGPHDHTAADGSGVLTGDEHDSYSEYNASAPPAAPSAGRGRLHARTRGSQAIPVWVTELGRRYELTRDYPVEAFGAVGDGATDDTAAIQAALDAAAAAGGGTVLLDARVYRITDTLHIQSWVRLAGRGYGSIIRQDAAGKHGVRAAPVPRPGGFNARTGPPTTPNTGIVIENVHFASGVDWTAQGKPTAGVAIYLSSSRMTHISHVWIDGYDGTDSAHYRTRRWAGGIWLDDVDPANIPCRHTSVVGFYIQSIGDDSQYAGDADGQTYPARKVGHCGILLRMVQTGADGASGWGHNFVNGIVQTEHATDSMEYYVGGQNAPGYCGLRVAGADGTHFMNVEFIDFWRCGWWEADGAFAPSGLSSSRYESCSFEVPGADQPAGWFRGAISQHEFWGCNFYGSGLPAESARSYGVDIDCIASAALRFLDCLFSAHDAQSYEANQAIRIANTYGQLWGRNTIRFTNCEIFGPTGLGSGILIDSGDVTGIAVVACIFEGFAYGISQLVPSAHNIHDIVIMGNTFIGCTTGIALWSGSGRRVLVLANTFDDVATPISPAADMIRDPSNRFVFSSDGRSDRYRLLSAIRGEGGGTVLLADAQHALLGIDSAGAVRGPYTFIGQQQWTTSTSGLQTILQWRVNSEGFGTTTIAAYAEVLLAGAGGQFGRWVLAGTYSWSGGTLTQVGLSSLVDHRNDSNLSATLAVSGGYLRVRVNPGGFANVRATCELRVSVTPAL